MSLFLWSMLMLLALLWGGAFVLVGHLLDFMTPLEIVAFRVLGAALALWLAVLALRLPLPRTGRVWAAFIALGVLNNVLPFTLITWGQQYIDSGMAAVLNGATPLFGAVLAHFFTADEKLGLGKIAGLVLGLAGVVLLVGPEVAGGGTGMMGQLAVLLGAFFYGVAGMVGKRLAGIPPMLTAVGQLTVSSAILMPMAWMERGFAELPQAMAPWLSVAALSIACTGLAYILYFLLISRAGATQAMTVTLVIPIVAVLMGMAFLGEQPGWDTWVAMATILCGVALVIRGSAAGRRWPDQVRP